MSVTFAAPARTLPRALCITAGVLLAHALVLWWLHNGLAQDPHPTPLPVLVARLASAEAPPPTRQTARAGQVRRGHPTPKPERAPASRATAPMPMTPSPAAPTPVNPVDAVSTAVNTPPAPAAPGAAPASARATAAAGHGGGMPGTDTGEPVELPSARADYLHNPSPEYPRMSRQRGEQGKVVVNVFIGVNGSAEKAVVKVSSGFERLDQTALETVRAWRYVPGKRGGVPQAMWFEVPITFVME